MDSTGQTSTNHHSALGGLILSNPSGGREERLQSGRWEGLSANQSRIWSPTTAQSVTEQAQTQQQVALTLNTEAGFERRRWSAKSDPRHPAPPHCNPLQLLNPLSKRLSLGMADWVRAISSFCHDWSNDSFRSLQHPIEKRRRFKALFTQP